MTHVAPFDNFIGAAINLCEMEEEEEWANEEEEEGEEDEDEELQATAFLVEGDPDFDNGPPADAEEYLRRVRWEANHCPKVVVATNTPNTKPSSSIMDQVFK